MILIQNGVPLSLMGTMELVVKSPIASSCTLEMEPIMMAVVFTANSSLAKEAWWD
jgi:hypothetical protein